MFFLSGMNSSNSSNSEGLFPTAHSSSKIGHENLALQAEFAGRPEFRLRAVDKAEPIGLRV